MEKGRETTRALKKRLETRLRRSDFATHLSEFDSMEARRVINPLISFFYEGDSIVKWRAVAAVGHVVSRLAETDMESARVIMRRFMWQLNDESGGIGWGVPEAMGEITAKSGRLAQEYHSILVSYIREDGNFLEHERLQRGVLWGLGRLAEVRPTLVAGVEAFLSPFLESPDPYHRGLAARLAGFMGAAGLSPMISKLAPDIETLDLYVFDRLETVSVQSLAVSALDRLTGETRKKGEGK